MIFTPSSSRFCVYSPNMETHSFLCLFIEKLFLFLCCFEAGPGVKICIMDMLDEFTEIKKLKQRPELAHRIDKYVLSGPS